MAAPHEEFHQSFQTSWEKTLEIEMLSEPVNTFVTDTNERSILMATAMNLVKSIQGIPYSRVMKVLFDSDESASMISIKILPIGVQIDHDHKTIAMI